MYINLLIAINTHGSAVKRLKLHYIEIMKHSSTIISVPRNWEYREFLKFLCQNTSWERWLNTPSYFGIVILPIRSIGITDVNYGILITEIVADVI